MALFQAQIHQNDVEWNNLKLIKSISKAVMNLFCKLSLLNTFLKTGCFPCEIRELTTQEPKADVEGSEGQVEELQS